MTFLPITPILSPAPLLQWALILDGRVIEVAQAATEPEAPEVGQWHDATGANPVPRVGMVYTDGSAYKLPRWAQIIGNTVANVTEQISAPGPGWRDCTEKHVGPGFTFTPEPDTYTPPPVLRLITVLAFRKRFTLTEKIAFEFGGLDNPADTMPERAQAAALRASAQDLLSATFIDLDRSDTRAEVLGLEGAGVLTAGRALQILDAPIASHEVYRV